MTEKIKILFLGANPVNVKYRLRIDEELREISKKIRASEERDAFELVAEWAVTPDDLQEILLRHKPHILHFSGHGSKKEGIVLEDKSGNTFKLNKKAFAGLLKTLKDNIRIVVLNACYAKDQANLLTETIDFTIGMNKAIGDRAAIVFAAHFYQSLAYGRSVQEAFRLAKGQLDLTNIPESKTPELLVKYGVNPNEGVLPKATAKSPEQPLKGNEDQPNDLETDRPTYQSIQHFGNGPIENAIGMNFGPSPRSRKR